MIEQVMAHVHNYFVVKGGAHHGEFKIEGGALSLPFLEDGNYFRIDGSLMNDGVFRHPATDLVDESFSGSVTLLAPPRAFLKVCEEIAEWQSKYAKKGAQSPFTSESFSGAYSYTVDKNAKGNAVTWQDRFADRLKPWRKLP